MLGARLVHAAVVCFLQQARCSEASVTSTDELLCAGDFCVPRPAEMGVSVITPAAGPLDGGTQIVVGGQGFRDFGSLMRCRFGAEETTASLTTVPGEWLNPYNHTKIGCRAPAASSTLVQTVGFEISLNGQAYSTSGLEFNFYQNPTIAGVSPARVSAHAPQLLTLTRSTDLSSGPWTSPGVPAVGHRCRFEAVVLPRGKRQVTFKEETAATVVDATELRCHTPTADFVGPLSVSVALNGQQFGSGAALMLEDNWHAPAQSGVPPSGREGVAIALLGTDVYLFGGRDASIVEDGFLNDLFVLHTDTMRDYYPSASAHDLTWQKLSLITGGSEPTRRAFSSLSAWGTTLLLFGGLAHYSGDSYNTTFEFSASRQLWQQVTVSGGPISPRSAHTAVVCAASVGCATVDGRPRMFVFGGWGLEPCGQRRPCYRHRNDLHALDLNNMSWAAVPVNTEQPLPDARKAHTATIFNGSQMLVFGGSAWTSDPEAADNADGYTTKQVADVWMVDLSGKDGYTWRPVHTVGDAPSPREGHVASLLGGRYVLVHGGYAHGQGEYGFLDDTHVLDTGVWPMVWSKPSLTGRIPSARHGHAAVALDDELYVFGGASIKGHQSDVHLLQLSAGNNLYDVQQPTYDY